VTTARVLLVGGTGMLGSEIAHQLLDRQAELRLLVRDIAPRDAAKRALLGGMADRGAEIVAGAMDDVSALLEATRDVEWSSRPCRVAAT
jgi:uncharacterized protein YbjT (DUF2867 family)